MSKIIKKVDVPFNEVRNSSFEVLRIVCIILIIAHHYSVHGGYGETTLLNIDASRIYIQSLSMFGRMACSIFVLITGYFTIMQKNHLGDVISIIKKCLPLIKTMLFYSLTIMIIVKIIKPEMVSLEQIIKAFIPIPFGNWYVVYYCLFMFLVPYINRGLLSISKREYKILIFVLIAIWCIIPTFTGQSLNAGNLDFFIVMYVIGSYIRLHWEQKYNNYFNLIVFIISFLAMIASVLFFDFVGINLGISKFIQNATYFCQFNTIIAVVAAVSIFLFFSEVTFFNSFINAVGKTVLGIYLIHDNPILRPVIWEKISPNINYISNPYFHSIIKIIIVFVSCMIIEYIRQKSFKYLKSNKKANKSKMCNVGI